MKTQKILSFISIFSLIVILPLSSLLFGNQKVLAQAWCVGPGYYDYNNLWCTSQDGSDSGCTYVNCSMSGTGTTGGGGGTNVGTGSSSGTSGWFNNSDSNACPTASQNTSACYYCDGINPSCTPGPIPGYTGCGAGGTGSCSGGSTGTTGNSSSGGNTTVSNPAATGGNSSMPPGTNLVVCGQGPAGKCGWNDLVTLGKNIINFLLYMAIPLAALSFAWAGFKIMTAAGDEGKVKEGREIFVKVAYGLVFALAAWLIVNVILTALLNPSGYTRLLG